jgi:hypothetical protein
MIISRAFAPMLLVGGLAVAVLPSTPALAQETNTRPSTGDQTPPAFDPTARIKYLHDRLRITAVARHGKLPPRRHEELSPPWLAEERANERGANH